MTSAGKIIPARKGPADVAVTRSTVSVVSPTFSGERLWAFARRDTYGARVLGVSVLLNPSTTLR